MDLLVSLDLALATAEDGEPPREMRIFPRGSFATKKGAFLYDDDARERVLAEWKAHGADKFVDYRHQALSAVGAPEGGKAAAWFELEDRGDAGLWAVNVRWTPPAREAIRNKEWRYLSPAFLAESGSKRIVELVNVALTNLPATVGQLPLVAAQSPIAEGLPKMNIAVSLGLGADAPEAEIVACVTLAREAQAELVKLTGKADVKEAIALVAAWRASKGEAETLRAQLATLESDRKRTELERLVDEKIQGFFVAPAERESLLSAGADNPDWVKSYLAVRTVPIVAAHGAVAPGRVPPPSRRIEMPDAQQLQMLGMTAEQYEKSQLKMVAEGVL